MRNRRMRTTKYIATILGISLCLGTVPQMTISATESSGTIQNQKRYAPEKFRSYGITYKDFVAQNGEPNSGHILIGTYLIDLVPPEAEEGAEQSESTEFESPITGEIYTAAMISQMTYQQEVTFYKSELSGSEWRDIDLAQSITYIMPNQGVRVSDEEMDEMLITVYVSGGKSTPTITGDDGDENPFLNPSPYNLDEISSMETLLKMTSDGTLKYSEGRVDADEVAENQSKRFLYERINYMFAHDEDTQTLPLQEGDDQKAALANQAVRAKAGASDAKLIEAEHTYTEANADIRYQNFLRAEDDTWFTGGESGTIASAARTLYHFSDTRDKITEPLDAAVVNLWNIYLTYKKDADAGKEGEGISNEKKVEYLYNLCSTCDSMRRAEVFYNLGVNPDFKSTGGSVLSALKEMSETGTSLIGRNITNMDYYTAGRTTLTGETGGFEKDEIVVTAVNKAIEDTKNLYTDYSAYALVRGVTAISILMYEDKIALMAKAERDDTFDSTLTELMYAEAIATKDGINDEEEAGLLTSKLIPTQNTILQNYLHMGLPETYNQVGLTTVQKQALLASQQSTAYNSESAMESLINNYLDREDSKDAYEPVMQGQLTWVRAEKSNIPDTDYARYAEEVRQKYEDFLVETMKALGLDTGDTDGTPSILDQLESELPESEDSDPKKTKELEELIKRVKENPPEVPPGTTAKVTTDPDTGLPTISYEQAGKDISAKSSSNALSDGKDSSDLTAETSTGTAGDSGDGSDGTAPGSTNSGDMLSNLEDALGMKFADMGPDGKIEMIAALNQFGRENGNDEALNLARELLDQVIQERNPFVYTKYRGSTDMEYVSLASVDRARLYTRYRLVREGMDMTMSRIDAGLSFIYRYGSPTVRNMDGKDEEMVVQLASQKDEYMNRGAEERFPYLDEEDAQVKLSCRAEYIVDSAYACTIASTMESRIEEIVKILTDLYK